MSTQAFEMYEMKPTSSSMHSVSKNKYIQLWESERIFGLMNIKKICGLWQPILLASIESAGTVGGLFRKVIQFFPVRHLGSGEERNVNCH